MTVLLLAYCANWLEASASYASLPEAAVQGKMRSRRAGTSRLKHSDGPIRQCKLALSAGRAVDPGPLTTMVITPLLRSTEI